MKIAQVLANYSLGEGDLLRRAMGKKDAKEMAKQRERFLSGAKENDVSEAQANEIFDLMEKFAEYGFNKSHSAAYAQISYHTAYLKTHYPVAFMAALMTSELGNQEKLLQYIADCREQGVEVLPPDVNAGEARFSVNDGKILYGLAGIKNVGADAIGEIAAERKENGPFTSLVDMAARLYQRKITKRVFEYLIKCGAMDSFGCSRAGLLAGLDQAVAVGQKRAAEKNDNQLSLMALVPEKPKPTTGLGLSCAEADLPEWGQEDKMAYEKEAIGFYLTGHPLLAYVKDIRTMLITKVANCKGLEAGVPVKVAVMITQIKEIVTKKSGDKMAFCRIEDLSGDGEITIFPKTYAEIKERLTMDQPLLFTAKISGYEGGDGGGEDAPKMAKLEAEAVELLADAVKKNGDPLHVRIDIAEEATGAIEDLVKILREYPGSSRVHVFLRYPKAECLLRLGDQYRVGRCPALRRALDDWEADSLRRYGPKDRSEAAREACLEAGASAKECLNAGAASDSGEAFDEDVMAMEEATA